jgi:hypothetical protein
MREHLFNITTFLRRKPPRVTAQAVERAGCAGAGDGGAHVAAFLRNVSGGTSRTIASSIQEIAET